jgi:hypothetical protein
MRDVSELLQAAWLLQSMNGHALYRWCWPSSIASGLASRVLRVIHGRIQKRVWEGQTIAS